MQIQPDQVTASLNGIVFGGVDQFGVDWTIDDGGIDGWSATAPTTRAQPRSRRSGSLLGASFASGRTVSWSGMIFAPTADLLRDAIDRLNAAVTLSDSQLFVTEASLTRYAWMRQGDDVITKHLMPTIATYSVQLTGKDWRKFGTDVSDRTRLPSTSGGLVIPAGGLVIAPAKVTAWSGTANASPSLYWAGGALQRTNYATNPHGAGGGAALWSASGYGTGGAGATSVVASGAPDGGSYSQIRWSTAASGGGASLTHPDFTVPASSSSRSITVSAYVMSNQASAFSLATQVGSTPTTGGDVTGIPTGQWARLSRTITVPASSTPTTIKLGVRISNLTGTTAGLILAGTMALAEEGTVLGDYFDGNTANVGGLTIDAVTVTGQVSLTNPGNDTGPLRLRVDGPCTGPVVTHVGTGDRLVFSSSLVLAAGEWLDIDMEKHQVYANGQSSRAGYITARGWFGFDPGPNTFAFTAAQYDAASQLTVAGTPAWR